MNVTLTLTLEQLQIIGISLGNMPYKDVAKVVEVINQQVSQAQNTVSSDTVVKADK